MTKARNDRLIAALIGKLPAPHARWSREERVVWLRTMAMAFDIAYGPCGGVSIAPEFGGGAAECGAGTTGGTAASVSDRLLPDGAVSARTLTPRRFYVDPDGFAMQDGRPIGLDDLPADAILWDERPGTECGDVAGILWRHIGATRKPLPAGVMLKPVGDCAPPAAGDLAPHVP